MMKSIPTLLLLLLLAFAVSAAPLPAGAQPPDAPAEAGSPAAPAPEPIPDADCLTCHDADDLVREAAGTAEAKLQRVTAETLKGTPHEGLACIDCHADIKELPHEANLAPPACAACHEEAQRDHGDSVHAHAAAKGNPDAPACADCHGVHDLLSRADERSRTHPKNISATCARCHSDPATSRRNRFNVADPLVGYTDSSHYKGIMAGKHAASCSDCHGHHRIRKSSDAESMTFKFNITRTCAQCHAAISEAFARSVHGEALARGSMDSPSCVDCHGEHDVKGRADPTSSIHPQNLSAATCARCHNNEKLMLKHGMESSRLKTYDDSYHSLALKGGLLKSATCASCHGVHDILPSSDPDSAVHPDRLVATCAKCHPKANANFVQFPVHSHRTPHTREEWIIEIVRWAYIAIIVLTIGGMLLHNAIIYFHHLREKYRQRKQSRLVVRFSWFEVINHLLLIVTFTTLVITGFALKFPDALWVQILAMAGLSESLRAILHRIAGVILILQGLAHGIWTVATPKGRKELWALMPVPADLTDAFHNMFHHLGIAKSKPAFARYNYIEKAEYWAMVWGTIIMGVTGLMLWFPAWVSLFVPAWVVKVAEIVHYYEAWLATLAIIVWHMFFTYFHPAEYPLSMTWIDGMVTEEEIKHHRPKEYEEMKGDTEPPGGGADAAKPPAPDKPAVA